MTEFLLKLLVSAAFTLMIKGGVALAGHWVAWWLAGVIALVVVFGGVLILNEVDGAWH